jgi:hypothetical protein
MGVQPLAEEYEYPASHEHVLVQCPVAVHVDDWGQPPLLVWHELMVGGIQVRKL